MHEGVYAERSFWVKPEIGSLDERRRKREVVGVATFVPQ